MSIMLFVVVVLVAWVVVAGTKQVSRADSQQKEMISRDRKDAYREARKKGKGKPKSLIIVGYCGKGRETYLDTGGRWTRRKKSALVCYDRKYASYLMKLYLEKNIGVNTVSAKVV